MIKLNDDDLLQSKIDPSVIKYYDKKEYGNPVPHLAISQNCHDLSVSLEGTVK